MLIPRVRPNYRIVDLFHALFVSESSSSYRTECTMLLSKIFNTDNILLTSSGRSSLYWVLKSLPQTKVVVPAYTCMVIVEAAMLAGKKVSFVETDYLSFNSNSFEDVDDDTIVVATHQYGIPCDIVNIVDYCHKKGAIVVEDCAAALGSKIGNRFVGTHGDYAIFSFDPSKLITTPPKGGFIMTKDKSSFDKIKAIYAVDSCTLKYKVVNLTEGFIYCLLKNKFLYRIFHYFTMGRKGKMQLSDHRKPDLTMTEFYNHGFYEWQASIAVPQIKQLRKIIQKRQEIYEYYDKNISNPNVIKPVIDSFAVCIRYSIKVNNKIEVYKKCVKEGVDMGFSFNYIAAPVNMRREHQICEEVLNLPYYYNMSRSEIKKVVEVVNQI